MRDLLTTVAELAGFVCLTVGASLVAPAAGWLVGGVSLVVVGYLGGRQ